MEKEWLEYWRRIEAIDLEKQKKAKAQEKKKANTVEELFGQLLGSSK